MTSQVSGQWLSLFINTVLQSLFVLAAAAVALICTRKASAARRHLVSVAALGVLLLIPLMSLLIPAPKPMLQVSGAGTDLLRSPVRTLSSPIRIERIDVPADASKFASQVTHSPKGMSNASSSPGAVVSAEARSDAGSPVAASGALIRFVPCLAALWFAGVLLVLGRLLIGFARVRRLAQLSDPALPEPLQRQLKAILSEVGFARRLQIVQASRQHPVSVPMTWGVRPATLLLPGDAGEWPVERLRVVVLHELAHIRRQDWLTQMLSQTVCALYWFHPLVWLLNRHTQIEAESACDDAVLLAGVRAKEYAGHLLDVVKAMQSGREAPAAAVAMARPMQVRSRLQSILNGQRNRQSTTRSMRTLVLLAMGILLCAISLLRPLAWAGRHQQSTVPKPFPAIGPMVDLSNGISVELVAVGSGPLWAGDVDWWTPDGKPLLELPQIGVSAFAFEEGLSSSSLMNRTFFVRLHVTSPAKERVDISTNNYVVAPAKSVASRLNRYGAIYQDASQLLPTRGSIGTFVFGFPPAETVCTYRFGVAAGFWETIATTRLTSHPTPGAISIPATAVPGSTMLRLGSSPILVYRDVRGLEHHQSLLGDHPPLGDVAQRIIALDQNGKEVMQERGRAIPLSAALQARIVELRLQTCPYQWAEFKDIHLQHLPMATPLAIATPTALPTFRHTFACGVTLAMPAITEKRTEGGLWWKPDGKPLTGPLKEYKKSVTFRSWAHETRPRIMLLQLTSPRAISYSFA
ncbi:MAG: TonB family protein, partial [Chthonomonadales bacterium]|nr:TonB family protein [Chthonomonadales bacterium]